MGISLGLSESAALFSMGRETEAARLLDRATAALREKNGPQVRRQAADLLEQLQGPETP